MTAQKSSEKQSSTGQKIIELKGNPEKLAIWASQVLISTPESGSSAFLGPYTPLSSVQSFCSFFPSRSDEHIMATCPIINPGSINKTHDIFRISYATQKDDYVRWFERVEAVKGTFWKEMGIFDAINLSV